MQLFVGPHSKMGHDILGLFGFFGFCSVLLCFIFKRIIVERVESDKDEGRSAVLLRAKLLMKFHSYQL